MADSVGDYVLDNGLSSMDTLADVISICNGEPASFADASTAPATGKMLGIKSFASPGDAVGTPVAGSPNGRTVTTSVVGDGSVGATGTASHWAILAWSTNRLLAKGALSAGVAVTSGGTWTLNAFTIRLPNQ